LIFFNFPDAFSVGLDWDVVEDDNPLDRDGFAPLPSVDPNENATGFGTDDGADGGAGTGPLKEKVVFVPALLFEANDTLANGLGLTESLS